MWTHVTLSCVFVFSQITTSLHQITEFLRGTLLFVQQGALCVERSLWEEVQRCVDFLKDKDLITVTEHSQGQSLQVTKLGKATYKGKPIRHEHEGQRGGLVGVNVCLSSDFA